MPRDDTTRRPEGVSKATNAQADRLACGRHVHGGERPSISAPFRSTSSPAHRTPAPGAHDNEPVLPALQEWTGLLVLPLTSKVHPMPSISYLLYSAIGAPVPTPSRVTPVRCPDISSARSACQPDRGRDTNVNHCKERTHARTEKRSAAIPSHTISARIRGNCHSDSNRAGRRSPQRGHQ